MGLFYRFQTLPEPLYFGCANSLFTQFTIFLFEVIFLTIFDFEFLILKSPLFFQMVLKNKNFRSFRTPRKTLYFGKNVLLLFARA